MSSISSLDIIDVVCEAKSEECVLDPRIFLCIMLMYGADAAAANPKGIKTLISNNLITFFINGNPVFSNGPRSLPRNPSDYIMLDN